jgi:hypothetical protein
MVGYGNMAGLCIPESCRMRHGAQTSKPRGAFNNLDISKLTTAFNQRAWRTVRQAVGRSASVKGGFGFGGTFGGLGCSTASLNQ